MCGRYTLARIDRLITAFPQYRFPSDAVPRYNVAPAQPVLAVRNDGSDAVEWLNWGLPAPWQRERGGRPMINARVETLASSWRRSLANRRCAIFADGFFEWRSDGAIKTPMLARLRGGEPFAFAGLWGRAQTQGVPPLDACTIVTGPPNALLATVHDRMPIILRPDALDAWLDPAQSDPAALIELLAPTPAAEMEIYPVSRRVNSAANDDAELIEPL